MSHFTENLLVSLRVIGFILAMSTADALSIMAPSRCLSMCHINCLSRSFSVAILSVYVKVWVNRCYNTDVYVYSASQMELLYNEAHKQHLATSFTSPPLPLID